MRIKTILAAFILLTCATVKADFTLYEMQELRQQMVTLQNTEAVKEAQLTEYVSHHYEYAMSPADGQAYLTYLNAAYLYLFNTEDAAVIAVQDADAAINEFSWAFYYVSVVHDYNSAVAHWNIAQWRSSNADSNKSLAMTHFANYQTKYNALWQLLVRYYFA